MLSVMVLKQLWVFDVLDTRFSTMLSVMVLNH